MSEVELPIRVLSLYGARTRQPSDQLVLYDQMHSLSPEEARRVAHLLLECAEAAETDTFVMEYITAVTGEERLAMQVLRAFRKARDEREKGG